MKTYKKPNYVRTSFNYNNSYSSISLEMQIERMLTNKEPIKDGAPLMYNERKDGVNPACNIRTDRWEVAVMAMSNVEKSYTARRDEKGKLVKEPIIEDKPIQATS